MNQYADDSQPDRVGSWMSFAQRPREQGGLGLAKHQAAGVVGNLVSESGPSLQPWGPTGDNGTAWGTAQWRNERLNGLQSFAQSQGLDPHSMEAQQAWMRHEFDTTHSNAYDALRAAQSPEDAATAMNRYYEVSADRSGQREANARSLFAGNPIAAINSAAGIRPSGTGALSMAFAPKGDDDTPTPAALSQPGALSAAGSIGPTLGTAGYLGQGLTNIGAALAGISSPAQATALTQQAALMPKAGNEWSVAKVDKNGNALMVNKQGQYRVVKTPLGSDEPTPGEAEAQKLSAKRDADRYSTITEADTAADDKLALLRKGRELINNPNVYQGGAGNEVMNAKNLAAGLGINVSGLPESQLLQTIATKLQLDQGKLLKGSISNYEDQLMKQASGLSLTNTKEANLAALDAQEKVLQYQKAIAGHYRDYKSSLGDNKLPGDEWDQKQADFRAAYEKAHPYSDVPVAAAQKPKALGPGKYSWSPDKGVQ